MQIVDDPAGLGEALELLHGRWFSAEGVLADPETGTLTVSLARRASEEPPFLERNARWLYRRWSEPLRETLLRIRGVRDYVIEEGEWRLEAVGFHAGTVSVYAAEAPVIRARVDALRLEVEETPTVVGERVESCTLGFFRRYTIRWTQ
jgi:hypothetical protein